MCMAVTAALLQYHIVWLATGFLFYISAFLAMTRLCQTLSNHYYGKWFYALLNQTLPYRLLYIVQPGVFTHDCSVLLTVPPLLRQIYTRRPCWGGERKERGKVYYKTLFLNYSFHLFKHWQHLSIRLYIRFSHENRPPFWRQIVLYCFHTLNLNTVQFTINLYIFI